MSNATVSFLGKTNNGSDANSLFLKVFSGEVLASFQRENKMLGMSTVRTISSVSQPSFLQSVEQQLLHTAGNEIVGSVINHAEKVITIDDVLLSSAFISSIDDAKNHYDVRSQYSKEMGSALAKKTDAHLLQLTVLGARASTTVTGGDGGSVIY